MTKRNTIVCFTSNKVRQILPRTIKNEWRIACMEAIKAGAAITEVATRKPYIPWDGRIA